MSISDIFLLNTIQISELFLLWRQMFFIFFLLSQDQDEKHLSQKFFFIYFSELKYVIFKGKTNLYFTLPLDLNSNHEWQCQLGAHGWCSAARHGSMMASCLPSLLGYTD
jgi:hypothetical protein